MVIKCVEDVVEEKEAERKEGENKLVTIFNLDKRAPYDGDK